MGKRYYEKMKEESAVVKKPSGRVVVFAGEGSIEYAEQYVVNNPNSTIVETTTN